MWRVLKKNQSRINLMPKQYLLLKTKCWQSRLMKKDFTVVPIGKVVGDSSPYIECGSKCLLIDHYQSLPLPLPLPTFPWPHGHSEFCSSYFSSFHSTFSLAGLIHSSFRKVFVLMLASRLSSSLDLTRCPTSRPVGLKTYLQNSKMFAL